MEDGEESRVFHGNAKEAISLLPTKVNVAVASSLATDVYKRQVHAGGVHVVGHGVIGKHFAVLLQISILLCLVLFSVFFI